MLHRTEGIVLRTTPFGEADLFVTYLTKDYGIVKTFAKSPRKTKSRFGSSLEPLTLSRISFWGKEDSPLPRLTQSDIIYNFNDIRSSIKCFLKVSEIIELTLIFMPERDACRKVYSLLTKTLRSFEDDCGKALLLLYFKVKFLEIAGFLPKLDNCGRCGDRSDTFFVSHGTVLCEKCSKSYETSLKIRAGVRNLYSHLLVWDLANINRIKPSGSILSDFSALLDEHIRQVTERDFKTRAFSIP